MATEAVRTAHNAIAVQLEGLRQERARIEDGGGKERIDKQHAAGKLTARERIDRLVDTASFQEIGLYARHRCTYFGMADKQVPADGVITGCATVDHRTVHLASQDFTVLGGAAGEVHCSKIADTMQLSLKTGSPFIFINDSGGARVQEGIDSLAGYAKVFYNNVMLSGTVPQIAIICGPCAGGAAYSPALTDFIIQTRRGQMFITGPQVIKQVTGEVVSADQLGGPATQMNRSGVVHLIAEDDEGAMLLCRRLLSFLPSNNLEDPPRLSYENLIEDDPELNELVPTEPKISYDVREVIKRVVDHKDFFELQPGFAANVVIGFARLQGRPIGIVASQPAVTGGRAGHQCFRQGCMVCALLQCLQHSAVDFRRCSRLSARGRSGIRRHYPARRENIVCLFRGHGSQTYSGVAQGVRRRIHCDVLQGPGG